jgi:sulfatase maturation enzyme AslB (radical SAM superfamily)
MLDGKRPIECSKCWDLENKGLVSDRIIKNNAFDFYADKQIDFIEQDCRSGNYSPQIIKLYTSNLCNSACVTCGPSASSSWQSLKRIPIVKQEIPDHRLNSIEWDRIKMLSFVGGEPLYEKKNLKILEKVANVGNTNCFISIVTNGSVGLTNSQQELFKKFKNLNICISIDGIGKQFEYIRYPQKWDTVSANIQQYREMNISLSVSFTISNLNILYYDSITNWFRSQNLDYNHNVVTFPSYFNIEVLPPNIKKNLPLIIDPNNFNKKLFAKFIKEIEEQDQIKGINIRDYLPELSKVIDKFRED